MVYIFADAGLSAKSQKFAPSEISHYTVLPPTASDADGSKLASSAVGL